MKHVEITLEVLGIESDNVLSPKQKRNRTHKKFIKKSKVLLLIIGLKQIKRKFTFLSI